MPTFLLRFRCFNLSIPTDEILKDAGLSPADIAALRDSGAVA